MRTFQTFDRTLGPGRRTTDRVAPSPSPSGHVETVTVPQQEDGEMQSTDVAAATTSGEATMSAASTSEGDITISASGDARTVLGDRTLPAGMSSTVAVPETPLSGDTATSSDTSFLSPNVTATTAFSTSSTNYTTAVINTTLLHVFSSISPQVNSTFITCLLYTSDAADER